MKEGGERQVGGGEGGGGEEEQGLGASWGLPVETGGAAGTLEWSEWGGRGGAQRRWWTCRYLLFFLSVASPLSPLHLLPSWGPTPAPARPRPS